MLTVIGSLKVQPGRGEEFERLFGEFAAKVKARQPGALLYQLNRSRAEAGAYKVIEIYRDRAALAAHRAADYFQPWTARLGAFLDGEPSVEFLDAVG